LPLFLSLNSLQVAIKIVPYDYKVDWDTMKAEILIMRSLCHRNITEIYSSFVTRGEHYDELWIVMPLMNRGSLRDVLTKNYPDGIKNYKLLATIFKEILCAMYYLEQDRVIHRDLKSANVLISDEGEVKLTDFGASREQTGKLEFAGTPCFMSPELVSRESCSIKSDIWSFGMMALEIAFGHAPFQKMEQFDVIKKLRFEPSPTMEDYKDFQRMPRSLRQIIKNCLHKNPAKRPSVRKLLSNAFIRKYACSPQFLADNL